MNQKKKAFTLIELLAVIVILAIIALIAVPVIMNIIDKANKAAFKDIAYGIINAGELYFAEQQLEPNGMLSEVTMTLPDERLELNGEVPEGQILITKEGKVAIAVENGRYCITKNLNDRNVNVIEDYNVCELPNNQSKFSFIWHAGTDTSTLTPVFNLDGELFLYKVADYTKNIDDLDGTDVYLYAMGQQASLKLSMEDGHFEEISDGLYTILNDIIVNLKENNEVNGILFSEPGIYFPAEAISYISIGFGIELKSNVVITENSIKWDGITSGLECLVEDERNGTYRLGLCKLSDEIPSSNIEDYKKITYYDADENSYASIDSDFADLSDDQTYIELSMAIVVLESEIRLDFNDWSLTKGIWFAFAVDNETDLINGYATELQFNNSSNDLIN